MLAPDLGRAAPRSRVARTEPDSLARIRHESSFTGVNCIL
jgi:hypothetical protein